jgi:hypothetical protein
MEGRYWRLEERERGPMLVDTMLEARSTELPDENMIPINH